MKRNSTHPDIETIRRAVINAPLTGHRIAMNIGRAPQTIHKFINGGSADLAPDTLAKLVAEVMPGYAFGLYKVSDQPSDTQKREERPACDSGTL